ncbi:porin [Vibrio astriarenae]
MNKLTKVSIAVASLIPTTVLAASLDVRHEYKSHTEQHATRVKLGDSIGNFLVDIEAKFKGEDGKFMEDLRNNGWELGLNYRHKLDDNWTLTYGMPIEARTAGMTYKPQVRATYNFDGIEGLSLSARYRLDIRTHVDANTETRNRFTGNVNYRVNDWRFGFEANWYKSNDKSWVLYDNEDTNYELNASARYVMGQWAPYVEFGDVNTSSEKSTRELRSRVGLTYSF